MCDAVGVRRFNGPCVVLHKAHRHREGVCENRDGWLVAWGLCGCMLISFSAVWLLPFTLL